VKITVPGKVVLLGEYAVLDGAPAVVAAVDRGVSCRVEAAGALQVETPHDDRFVRRALEAVGAPAARYVFSDWNPVNAGLKVGFGGSAAATVAAVVAGTGGRLDRGDVWRIAHAVHSSVQGGGSGVDVAASVYGGVSRFERGVVSALPMVNPSIVFTGTSAATAPRVAQYLAWNDRAPFVARMAALVDAFPGDPVAVLREGQVLLRGMAERAGVAYWTEEIDTLTRLADDHGGAAKPGGAGGGDIVVALFPDVDRQASFEAAAASFGFQPVPVVIATGCRADS
jgi:phosphomevalonate kinase